MELASEIGLFHLQAFSRAAYIIPVLKNLYSIIILMYGSIYCIKKVAI